MIARDGRLRAVNLLLVAGLVGHATQLLAEDTPWAGEARERYWTTPGWHLFVPPWVVVALAVAVVVAAAGVAARRSRPWCLALAVAYAAHYLTYPFRIRNHMTLVLFALGVQSAVWLVGALAGAADLRGRGERARTVDRFAATGVAVVLVVTYASAALHKVNADFLALDPARSDAAAGVTAFLRSGGLAGARVPAWVLRLATWGTVAVEAALPVVAWRAARWRSPAVLGLMAFHVPHVAAMGVADYPMLASALYPALFSPGHWRRVARSAAPSAWTLGGAALGAATQAWFAPRWGPLEVYGVLVLALWGYGAGALARECRAREAR